VEPVDVQPVQVVAVPVQLAQGLEQDWQARAVELAKVPAGQVLTQAEPERNVPLEAVQAVQVDVEPEQEAHPCVHAWQTWLMEM